MADLNTIKGLSLKLRLTRWHLTVLQVLKAFWPVFVLVSAFVFFALFGVFDRLPAAYAAIATLLTLLGLAGLLWRGVRQYRPVSEAAARNVLDQSSDLRPIASLTDRPAQITKPGQDLWQAHMLRLEKAAAALRLPRLGAAWQALDPYYMRGVLPVMLALAFLVAGGDALARLQRALMPDYGVLAGADQLQVDAWITPPDYTRRPPVFLTGEAANAVRVPAGSEITVRAQARSAPKLRIRGLTDTRDQRLDPTPDGAFEIKTIVTEDANIAVHWWGKRAAWQILASPDDPPTADFDTMPSLGPNDRTIFSWSVADDYGVTRLELALQLIEPVAGATKDERREPIELPNVQVKSAKDEAEMDLTRHPWAGLKVRAELVATDGAGNEGRSAAHEFKLPEKLFLQTLARAAQEIRVTTLRETRAYEEAAAGAVFNRLNGAPEGIKRASLMLEAITFEPYRFFGEYQPFLGLSTAQGMLKAANSTEAAHEVDGLLWAIALKAEYGSAADALAALLAAKKALEKALRDGAPEEEIARLTEAFRQAAENYVQARLAEAIANGIPEGQQDGLDNQLSGGGGGGLGQSQLEEMLEALEDLAETGARDQARQLLSDITNMLENLEFQQGNGSGGDGFALPNQSGEGEEGEEQSEEEQALAEDIEDLSETLREQRELNDDTLEAQRSQRQRGQPGPGGQPSGGGETEDGTDLSNEALAERQAAIGDVLEELARRDAERGQGAGQASDEDTETGEAGGVGEAPEATEDAGGGEDGDPAAPRFGGLSEENLESALQAQRRAEDALRRGQFGRARRNQDRVAELLREEAATLSELLDELAESQENAQQTDPFGNPIGGPGANDSVEVPDKSERQRALDILEELRRRFEAAEDPDEREYLKRLLDRF